MAAERAFLGKTGRRTALVGGAGLGAAFLPDFAPTVHSAEDLSTHQNAELEKRYSLGAIFYALDTCNASYLATATNSFEWTGYEDSTWSYAPRGREIADYFENAMTFGKTEALFWQETARGARIVVSDLALPRGRDTAQASFVELEMLGNQYVISKIEEISAAFYTSSFLNSFKKDEWKDCEANGYWVRTSHLQKTGQLLTEPGAEINYVAVKHVVCAPGIISEVLDVGGGEEEGGIFHKFLTEIRAKKDGPSDSVHSAAGVRVNSKGVVYADRQLCEDTLSDPRDRSYLPYDFMLVWFGLNPNGQLRVVTHSQEVHTWILALMRLKKNIEENPNFPIKPGQVNVFFTHAMPLGLNKPILKDVAKLMPQVDDDCKLLGAVPELGVLSHPTAKYMFWRWDNRRTWGKEVEDTISWFVKRGSRMESGGNWMDRAISIFWGSMDERQLKIAQAFGGGPEILRQQMVPGVPKGKQHMFFLGHANWGHDRFLKDKRGLDKVLDFALAST